MLSVYCGFCIFISLEQTRIQVKLRAIERKNRIRSWNCLISTF
ncbi:hypothetical protein VIBNIMADA3021_290063 [Vibrio nigripulchritudo MADA3021]|nr:hypothetical protein VIBNIMADA3021_290063 [Vibrio nigripulchritudo MADA3021]